MYWLPIEERTKQYFTDGFCEYWQVTAPKRHNWNLHQSPVAIKLVDWRSRWDSLSRKQDTDKIKFLFSVQPPEILLVLCWKKLTHSILFSTKSRKNALTRNYRRLRKHIEIRYTRIFFVLPLPSLFWRHTYSLIFLLACFSLLFLTNLFNI